MSVVISIGQYPGNTFSREIVVSRVPRQNVSRTLEGRESDDDVYEYEAECRGDRARFLHRYGDNLFILTTEAIQALGLTTMGKKA